MKTATRQWFYKQIDPEAWDGSGISPLNLVILGLVLFSVVSAVLRSEPTVREAVPGLFVWINWLWRWGMCCYY